MHIIGFLLLMWLAASLENMWEEHKATQQENMDELKRLVARNKENRI